MNNLPINNSPAQKPATNQNPRHSQTRSATKTNSASHLPPPPFRFAPGRCSNQSTHSTQNHTIWYTNSLSCILISVVRLTSFCFYTYTIPFSPNPSAARVSLMCVHAFEWASECVRVVLLHPQPSTLHTNQFWTHPKQHTHKQTNPTRYDGFGQKNTFHILVCACVWCFYQLVQDMHHHRCGVGRGGYTQSESEPLCVLYVVRSGALWRSDGRWLKMSY